MKSHITFSLAACAALGICLSPLVVHAQPAGSLTPPVVLSPAATALKGIEAGLREKKFAEALAQAEATLQMPGLTADEKLRALKLAADASAGLGVKGMPDAARYREAIIADVVAPNSAKIEALNGLADAHVRMQDGLDLQQMDVSRAEATVKRALELPNLTTQERALALTNIGKFHERRYKFAEARESYQQVLALGVDARTQRETRKLIADTFAKEGKAAEATAIYTEQKFDLPALYTLLGDTEKRTAESLRILDDQSVADGVRWMAFQKLPNFDRYPPYPEQLRGLSEKYLPGFLEKDPNRILFLKRFIAGPNTDPAYVEYAAPLMLKAPALSAADYARTREALVEALAEQGKSALFLQEASSVAADEKVPAATRLWASLIEVASAGGPAANIAKTMAAGGQLPTTEKADAVLRAARSLVRADVSAPAENLYNYHQSLVAKLPRAAITCRFVAQAPIDVNGWLRSPILKQKESRAKLDRPYGDNLKFLLETDSAVMGRNTSAETKADSGDTDTDLHVACDADGLSIFLNAHDKRVAEVANGLISGGSFEIYLAPGAHNAYFTYLLNMPSSGNDPTGFTTSYPNATYRTPSPKDGTLKSLSWKTETGYANSLFLGWEALYDKLPENGTKWQFDAIRWTRSGGLSFGGSESVHNRSSWGDIVFQDLSPQSLNAIKRNLVFKAVAKYKKAKSLIGPVGNWPDRQLGDPAFYAAKVEPLFRKLDGYAALATKDITPAQVETVFREAVPGWMELEFQVAALRAEYLREKQMARN